MWTLSLTAQEIETVRSLVHEIRLEHKSIEEAEFVRRAGVYAQELPRRLRQFLSDFRLLEPVSGLCLISGYPIDSAKIGKTPSHWKWKVDAASSIEEQIIFVLYGCLLGDPFAWATQQDGYLMHDVFPIESNRDEQLSTGSEQLLWWHTEDAFHPHRADYIGLMCLRNPDRVPTTIGVPDLKRLSQEQLEILFERKFLIMPDDSHSEKNESDLRKQVREHDGDQAISSAYDKIKQMSSEPQRVSILFGNRQNPYVCLDPHFTTALDHKAIAALDAIVQTVEDNMQDIVLKPGDCCFIDNYRAVHGRKAFKPRFDGTDRWLKRLNLTRDLRKSQGMRGGCEMRIIL